MTMDSLNMSSSRSLSAEQLLLIADEVCRSERVSVVDYGFVAAAAAVTGAQFDGVPVFQSVRAARKSLEQAIVLLEPLSGANQVFARVAGEVFARINDEV